ncbi:MAG: hypothetical protein HZB33_06335, partial [Nitrospirae bacterium]|nr:hypothetical protein [Nitrospirota bacterium]
STSNFRLNFIYNLGYVEIGKAPEVLDAGNTGNTGNMNDTNNTDNVENDEEVKKVRKPKRRIFHIPFIYFDFSRDTYDGFGGSSTNDRLNVRAEQTEGHYYYSAEYRMGDTSVSPAVHYLNLRATYDELYADRITRFSNYASGNLIKSAGNTTIAIYDQFAWSRQMGKGINDFVLLSGGGQYFNTNDKNNYVLNLGVTRNSIYSERLAYSFNVVGTYDPGQERSPASGTASGSLFYRPLDYVVISGQSSAGVSSDINSYSYSLGAQADRYFKGLMVNPGFLTSYAVSGKDTERGSKIYLNLATSLGSRFSLSAQNTYFMRDLVRDAVSSSSKELSLQVSLSAKLSRYLVTAYVAYGNLVSSLKTSSMIAGTSVETNWSGRVFLNMRGYAQKSDNNPVFMFLTTNLGFNWRQVAASLEYSHSRYSSTTDNRLYVRMTRSFYTVVRPFF